ncbi:GntR family transcriptional regulator [Sphingomonas oryzagri]
MSPAHVLEPTYDAIKRRLVAGDWPMGFRLEAARLAADLGVSITPVRDSLNRLAGERLVDMVPGEGFRVPSLSEQGLRDLLDLNLLLLLAATGEAVAQLPTVDEPAMDHATATALLFLAIASLAANGEIAMVVQSLNERLHPLRQLDDMVLPQAADELDQLHIAFSSSQGTSEARALLTRYHVNRMLEAGRFIRLIAQKGRS